MRTQRLTKNNSGFFFEISPRLFFLLVLAGGGYWMYVNHQILSSLFNSKNANCKETQTDITNDTISDISIPTNPPQQKLSKTLKEPAAQPDKIYAPIEENVSRVTSTSAFTDVASPLSPLEPPPSLATVHETSTRNLLERGTEFFARLIHPDPEDDRKSDLPSRSRKFFGS